MPRRTVADPLVDTPGVVDASTDVPVNASVYALVNGLMDTPPATPMYASVDTPPVDSHWRCQDFAHLLDSTVDFTSLRKSVSVKRKRVERYRSAY